MRVLKRDTLDDKSRRCDVREHSLELVPESLKLSKAAVAIT